MTGEDRDTGSRGRLVLIVGVSGAGKDTLFALARRKLRSSQRFVFQPLDITRPRHQAGETHTPISEPEYLERLQNSLYALSWRMDGCGYGLPAGIGKWLEAGKTVVVIGSRAVLPEAMRAYPGVRAILVTAEDSTIRQRLAERGRESPEAMERRLSRTALPPVAFFTVENEGSPEAAADRMIMLLKTMD